MKHHMVFTVEQKNLALGSAQLAAKSFCELYRRKSSTDDDHSHWLHFLAPTARVASEISVPRLLVTAALVTTFRLSTLG